MKRVAIVGAGAGGLAAAHDLARAGHQVTIFEADDHVGGLAAGFSQPNWDWSVERYYHHWFASDKHILGLIDELGWSDRVIFPRPVTVVFHDEQFYPLDSPLTVLRFPGIPFLDRLRVGVVVAYLRYIARWEPLEQVTAHEWLSSRVGERAYTSLWEPLLIGKFGPHYKDVNMAWFWARIKARTPRLGTYKGGFQAFMDDLADQVQSLGGEIRLETPVEEIKTVDDRQLELRVDGEQQAFDDCLVTTSPGLLARLAPGLPEPYLRGLNHMKSMGAVVMTLSLNHRLSEQGHYWHNLPKTAGFPFLSLVEHTSCPANILVVSISSTAETIWIPTMSISSSPSLSCSNGSLRLSLGLTRTLCRNGSMPAGFSVLRMPSRFRPSTTRNRSQTYKRRCPAYGLPA